MPDLTNFWNDASGGGTPLSAANLNDREEAVYDAANAYTDAHISDASGAHAASAISYAGGTGMSATDVEAAIDELATEKSDSSTLTAHINDTTAAHAASAISYGGGTGMSATDVEAAIDELATEKANSSDLTAHTGDSSAAHAASAISFSPTGTIAATDVQTAIAEVASEAGGGSSQVFAVVAASGNATTDTANINAAITAAAAAKGTVMLSPSTVDYQSNGGHSIGVGVTFDFNGQYVKHLGNNTFLKVTNTGAADYKPLRSAVMNGWLKGNNGAAAIGIEVCDSWAALLRNFRIGSSTGTDAYSGTAGIGLRVHNENASSWCEGLRLEDVFLIQNKIGLQYKRTSGTDSLAYHDYKNLAIAVGASQTGIDMGVAGDNLNLYNSFLDIRMWVQGASAILIDVGANFKVYGSTFAYIRGEAFGVTATGIKNRGGRFIPSGKVAFWRDATVTDDRSAGKTLVDHLGIGRSYADTAVMPTLAGGSTASDVPDISHAGLGFVNQSNEEYIALWGYGGGGATRRIFSVAAKPFANDQGGATDTSANERMGVDADGLLSLMPAGAGIAIKEGTNGRSGLATLVGGTVTVSTTKVTANSRIYLSVQTAGGTQGFLRVSARTAGTSFTITSTQATETSTVAWLIVEPA